MAEFIKVINHGENPMDLTHLGPALEGRPIELHYNTNGSIEDKPTFCIVMQCQNHKVVGQFSLKTLEDCLAELGYEIKKL